MKFNVNHIGGEFESCITRDFKKKNFNFIKGTFTLTGSSALKLIKAELVKTKKIKHIYLPIFI